MKIITLYFQRSEVLTEFDRYHMIGPLSFYNRRQPIHFICFGKIFILMIDISFGDTKELQAPVNNMWTVCS